MSKLDDIFDQYRSNCFLGKDAGLEFSTNMLALSAVSHKQQIRDLMLKVVDSVYGDTYENDKRATEMWHDICKEIKEL